MQYKETWSTLNRMYVMHDASFLQEMLNMSVVQDFMSLNKFPICFEPNKHAKGWHAWDKTLKNIDDIMVWLMLKDVGCWLVSFDIFLHDAMYYWCIIHMVRGFWIFEFKYKTFEDFNILPKLLELQEGFIMINLLIFGVYVPNVLLIDSKWKDNFMYWKCQFTLFHVWLQVVQCIMIPMLLYFFPLFPCIKNVLQTLLQSL